MNVLAQRRPSFAIRQRRCIFRAMQRKLLSAGFVGFVWLLLASCGASKKDLRTSIAGNWLILYPEHKLASMHQREVYGRHQDSLIKLYGLKLIALGEDGAFHDLEDVDARAGNWLVTTDSLLKIREAGKGFNPFNSQFTSFQKDELLLTQYLPLEDEKVKLVWHLKKIGSDNKAGYLFTPEANAWRRKPAMPESDKDLRKRLSQVLTYYGDYFALVGKEAIYFSPARVALPLRYYQHGVGMRPENRPDFNDFFYNEVDATKAYQLLERSVATLHGDFPSAENFVLEYGLFLTKLSGWVDASVR